MEIVSYGAQDYFFSKFNNEHISITRPSIKIRNLVIGKLYIDVAGECRVTNHSTGATGVIHFQERGWSSNSSLSGKIIDPYGNEVYEIEGSWIDEIWLRRPGSEQKIPLWKEHDPLPDYKKMFMFNNTSIQLNYKCDDMYGVVAPTDTRFRGDQRLFEEGKVDEADDEKMRLEVKQRKARKLRNDSGQKWETNFFKEGTHPFIPDFKVYNLNPENNYWERRERGDWTGLPDLW